MDRPWKLQGVRMHISGSVCRTARKKCNPMDHKLDNHGLNPGLDSPGAHASEKGMLFGAVVGGVTEAGVE